MPSPTSKVRIASTLDPWERVLTGAVGIGIGVFMVWGTFAWMFLTAIALDVPCGGSLSAGSGIGTVLGVVVGLLWTTALSLLLTGIRGRGLKGRAWLVGPAACLALVAVGVIDEARTPPPDPPPTAAECDIYD